MSLGFFERDGPAGIIFRYDMRYVVAAVTCDVCIPKTLKLTYEGFTFIVYVHVMPGGPGSLSCSQQCLLPPIV